MQRIRCIGPIAALSLATLALRAPPSAAGEPGAQPAPPAAVQRDIDIVNRLLRERRQKLNPPPAPATPVPAAPSAASAATPPPTEAKPVSTPVAPPRPPPDERVIHAAVERLGDEDAAVRRAAQAQLVAAGPAAVPALIDALEDPAPAVRLGAVRALGKIRDARAAEPLASLLGDPSKKTWDALRDAISALGRDAAPSLIEALASNDQSTRWRAASLMGGIRDPRFTEPLIETLNKDRSTGVRVQIATALGRMRDRQACEALLDALHDW